jgi:hypothetical protein
VNRDWDVTATTELNGGEKMLVERVYPTRPDQSNDVQRAVVPACILDQLSQDRNAKKLAGLDGL